MSSIPSERVEVLEATLELYGSAVNGYANGWKKAKPATKEWSEDLATWATPWAINGGSFTKNNEAQNQANAFNAWDVYDVTDAVNYRHVDGIFNGFFIEIAGTKNAISYASSENSDVSKRPRLTVTYRILENEAPFVNITTPNADTDINPNETIQFTWTANDNIAVEAQKLWFKTLRASKWTLLDSVDGNTFSYEWTAPCEIEDSLRVMVEAFDDAGNRGVDTSDFFAIGPDSVNFKPSNALMISADWYGAADNLGSAVTFEKSVTVSGDMTLAKKTTAEYPWVNLTTKLHDNQTLEGTEYISVTYKSSNSLKLNLLDPDLANEGACHSVTLDRSSELITTSFHVNSCTFKQPSWVSSKSDISLENVYGIAIEPNIDSKFGGSCDFEIEEIRLYGYSGTVEAKEFEKVYTAEVYQNIKITKKDISFTVSESGLCNVKLYSLNGTEVYNRNVEVESGVSASIAIGNMNLAASVYLLQLEIGSKHMAMPIVIQ